MFRSALPRTIFLLLLLICASSAKALLLARPEPSLERHTVEALTAVSPLIMTATVSVASSPVQMEIQPIDILKAPPGFGAPKPFAVAFDPINEPAAPPPPLGTKVLIFLAPPSVRTPAWEIYDYVILAPGPARSACSTVIRDLTFNPVPDAQQVLNVVQQDLRRTPPTTAVETFSNYPFHLENLPADDRLLPTARQWVGSPEPLARLLAVSIMQAHPDPQDVPLLTTLLQDPYAYDMSINLSPWSGHEYLVRQAAARALTDRGINFSPPILATPRTDLYKPFSIFPSAALLVVPPSVYFVGLWLFRKSLRRKLSFRKSVISILTVACIWTSGIAAVLWHRSNETIDDFVYASNGTIVEAYSLRGIVGLRILKTCPADTPLVHLSLAPILRSPDDQYFHERMAFGGITWGEIWKLYDLRPAGPQLFGWGFGQGITRDIPAEPFSMRSGVRLPLSGRGIGCTYQTLVLLLLLFPILRLLHALVSKLRQTLRNRRLRKIGLCPACSHDLRAHHPGERCPECGTHIPSLPHTPLP